MFARRLLWLAVPLFSSAIAAQTSTVVLSSRADNTLYEDPAGTLSNGGGQKLFVGRSAAGAARRALLSFDVSSIPAGSRIVDVQVQLQVLGSAAAAPTSVALHRVEQAWGEAASVAPGDESAGGAAMPGDATWTCAVMPGAPWLSPGGDFAGAPSGVATMPLSGPFTIDRTVELIADVQDWLTGLRQNHGWVLKTDETQNGTETALVSREGTTLLLPGPRLQVTYLAPGHTLSVGTGCMTSGGVPFAQSMTGVFAQGNLVTIGTHSNIPLGLFVTMLSYDIRPEPLEVEPGCYFWLRQIPFPNLGICIQDMAGNWQQSFVIPVDSQLFGLPMAVQSVIVDWAHPRQYAVSNANLLCIG